MFRPLSLWPRNKHHTPVTANFNKFSGRSKATLKTRSIPDPHNKNAFHRAGREIRSGSRLTLKNAAALLPALPGDPSLPQLTPPSFPALVPSSSVRPQASEQTLPPITHRLLGCVCVCVRLIEWERERAREDGLERGRVHVWKLITKHAVTNHNI